MARLQQLSGSKSKDLCNLLACWQLLIWSREANDTHKLDSVGLSGGEFVTGHLSEGLRAAAFLSITIVVLARGCDHPRSTPENATAASSEVSQALIGKQITIRGKFSLWGKFGGFVDLDNQQVVYIELRGPSTFTWGKPYSEMEGKLVEATGTLRFYHDAAPVDPNKAYAKARAVDHFYFEAETAQLRLIKP
jgi:hypothetical protein